MVPREVCKETGGAGGFWGLGERRLKCTSAAHPGCMTPHLKEVREKGLLNTQRIRRCAELIEFTGLSCGLRVLHPPLQQPSVARELSGQVLGLHACCDSTLQLAK